MARKPQVTLTFAGDSKDLEKAIDRVGSEARDLEKDVDRAAGGFDRLDKAIGDGGRRFGDYGTGLGGLGDRADEVDTRMMGLSDGIQGVSDLMRTEELRPHEYAMALSDIGSSIYNTVVPSLQSGINAIKDMSATTVAGVAGLAALTAGAAFLAHQQSKTVINTDELTKALESNDAAVQDNVQEQFRNMRAMDELDAAFAKVLEDSPQLADEFIAQAEAAGIAESDLREMRDQLEEVGDTTTYAAEQLSDLADAMAAQFDPLFGMVDAERALKDARDASAQAQVELNAAIAEYGATSPEAAAAQQALTDAQYAAGQAAFDVTQAALNLQAAVESGAVSVDDARAQLELWVQQGVFTREEADLLALSFGGAAGQAERYAGDYHADLTADTTDATTKIADALAYLANYEGEHTATLRIRQTFANAPILGNFFDDERALGGPVSAGSAYLVGEEGPEIFVPDVSGQILSHSDSMASMRGVGGTTVNVVVQGSIRSDRDLVRLIRDEIDRGGLRGAF